MFDINGGEFLVIAMLALLVLGPDRLPELARQLAGLLRRARRFASGAREQLREELGPEFDEVDWRRYDIRQYHPRRIVQNALSDISEDESTTRPVPPAAGQARPARSGSTRSFSSGGAGAVERRPADGARAANGASTAAARRARGPVRDATPLPPSPPPTSWAAAADRARSDGEVT